MSATLPARKYRNIQLRTPSEDIWVSPVNAYESYLEEAKHRPNDDHIILMGPTGSGKSSFIEAIASKSTRTPLGIAKDQLESVTQQACIYELKNLKDNHGDTIYIIDTPGFADPRISELQVLDKIACWRDRSNKDSGFVRLLYFHPITDIRMPASRKRCLDMVQGFWGLRLSARATLVTSMWDRIPELSRNAAETRFAQLSNSHWGDWITEGSPAVKFENTFDSAMEILDKMCDNKRQHNKYPELSGLGMEGTTGNPIFEALSSRLSSLEQQRATLLEDLAHPTSQGQTKLLSILNNELAKTEILLQKFSTEMEAFLKRFGPLHSVEPVDTAPSAAGDIVSPPEAAYATQTPHSMEDDDSVLTAPGVIVGPSRTTQTSQPMETVDTVPIATGVIADDIEPPKVSLPKRLSRWAHKKVDSLHLGRVGRKGA